MNNTTSVAIDVAYGDGETADDAIRSLTRGLNLITRRTGVTVGGGWPEVEFTGPQRDIEAMLERYDGDDELAK